MSKGIIKDKEGNNSEPIMKEIVNNKSSKNIKCSKDIKLLKNKLINSNRLVKVIINIIMGLFIFLGVGLEFGFLNTIFFDSTDGESNNNVDSNKSNQSASANKNVKDESYSMSANVGKGVITEGVAGAIEGISNAITVIVGGMAGSSLGVAALKASKSLPPVHKAAVGVGTAIATSLGVTTSTAVAKELVKNISNNKEEANPLSVPTISNNKTGSGDSGKDGLIPSVLETELSPLQMILNYEVILGVLILVHMCLLILI
jgi:hypothetical protein